MSLATRTASSSVAKRCDPGDRAERLLAAHRHRRGHAREHRRLEEGPAELVAGAAEVQLRPTLERVARRGARPSPSAAASISGPTFTSGSVPAPTASRVDRPDQLLEELVVDAVLDEDPVRGDAGLAGVAVLAEDRARDRLVDVGVVEDDERRVAAELERDLLQPGRALGHQQLPDLIRAGEAELADERARGHLLPDRGRVLGVAR